MPARIPPGIALGAFRPRTGARGFRFLLRPTGCPGAVPPLVLLQLALPPHECGGQAGECDEPAATTSHGSMLRGRTAKVELPGGKVRRPARMVERHTRWPQKPLP